MVASKENGETTMGQVRWEIEVTTMRRERGSHHGAHGFGNRGDTNNTGSGVW